MRVDVKKLFSIILILVLICTSVTIVYGGDNYITVRDVVNRLDKVAGSYNPQYTKEKLLSSSSFVLDEDVTKAQCYYLISRAFDNFPQLQGDCLANSPTKITYYDMPMWAGNEIGKMVSCGLVDNDGSGAFYPLQNVTEKEFDTILQRVYRLYGTDKKDDFYSYVNHNELLKDNSAQLEDTGNLNTIDEAQKHNVEMFNSIVNECIDGDWQKGSKESAIQNLYLTIEDFKTRNEQGVEPIKPFLDQLSQVKDDSQLNAFVEEYTKKTSMAAFVNFSLAPQPSDNGKYALYFDCYVPLMYISVSQNPDELERYKKYITDMFEMAGESNKQALEDAENVLNVEKLLSSDITANGDSEFMETIEADGFDDSSNIMEKLYKSYDLDFIDSKFKTLDLKAIVKAFGYDENLPLIIWDMNRVNKLSELFNGEHSQELASLQKAYMISIGGMYLSQNFYDLYDNFLMDIYGTDQSVLDQNMAPRTFISNQMSVYISQIFCQKYFDKSKKEQVIKIAENLRDTFRERLKNNRWLSGTTKIKAIEKLDNMDLQVGYPDNWRCYLDYADIKSPEEGGTYYSNMLEINRAIVKGAIDFSKNYDVKDMWEVQPYDVNAYYVAEKNKMIIPAGICYALSSDSPESNYGTIGTVIAHEMVHAFDTQGAMYDKDGNLTDWWSAVDYSNFKEQCKKVEKFYDGYESATGIETSGQLTLNENIADIGAMACALDAVSKLGNVDYDKCFTAYGKLFFTTSTRQYLSLLAVMDQHSYGSVRVKRTLSNFQKFYDTYGINEYNGMYVKPEERINIW